jgi:ABC-2 type transport system permease protein
MSQIASTYNRMLKELLREKVVLFWTIAWPLLWVILSVALFSTGIPDNVLPYYRGSYAISMCSFALMTVGMGDLPGNVAGDRTSGMLTKLKSMPFKPWRDFLGRILSFLTFSAIPIVVVLLVGSLLGAQFPVTLTSVFGAIGYFVLMILGATGIGLIISALIKSQQGAIMTGVGMTVLTASISGMFAPYSFLPSYLQTFSKLYPLSAINSSLIYLLEGEAYAGYNPLNPSQFVFTIVSALILFLVGALVYSKYSWGEH